MFSFVVNRSDISTTMNGDTVQVKMQSGMILNFTRDAARELMHDFLMMLPETSPLPDV